MKNVILQGDALTVLKTLESETVDCIITSPPYFNLRDYKIEGQIGVEKTIDEYLEKLLIIFDDCKRVLKKSGTCWVVLGDTYAGSGINRNGLSSGTCSKRVNINNAYPQRKKIDISDKSLCMIPQRFGIKMLEHGWIVRSIPIWHKPNCMPSSAMDRFTLDYEFIFFFTKSPKYYFKTQYEPHTTFSDKTMPPIGGVKHLDNGNPTYSGKTPYYNGIGRIKRCVWSINTKPFSEAHFAVFPEELVLQCLNAGCSPEGLVLDPFMGSGTVGLVALKNNVDFLGIELNPEYVAMANKRLKPYLDQTKLTQFLDLEGNSNSD